MTLLPRTDVVRRIAELCRQTVPEPPGDLPPSAEPPPDGLPAGERPAPGSTGPTDDRPDDRRLEPPLRRLLAAGFRTHRLVLPAGAPAADRFTVLVVRPHADAAVRVLHVAPDRPPEPIPDTRWATAPIVDGSNAPTLLLVCGDLDGRAGPPPGYPHLLLGAGALGHALCLAAPAEGLDCRLVPESWRPATVAARRHRPGLTHLLTVAARHLDGSSA